MGDFSPENVEEEVAVARAIVNYARSVMRRTSTVFRNLLGIEEEKKWWVFAVLQHPVLVEVHTLLTSLLDTFISDFEKRI